MKEKRRKVKVLLVANRWGPSREEGGATKKNFSYKRHPASITSNNLHIHLENKH